MDITQKFRNDVFNIQAGNSLSGMGTDYGQSFKNFYMWGGDNTIYRISKNANVKGSETFHGLEAFAKGGSQNTDGLALIDTLSVGTQAHMMKMAYDNIAVLQERALDNKDVVK